MPIDYICIFIMILFPYIFAGIAKSSRLYNNNDPRSYLEHITGWRRRAHCVQLNSFEAFPAFAAAVIIAHLLDARQSTLNILAITFVCARILYAICYLYDKATMRSLFWLIGFGCVIGIFGLSL